MPRHVRHRPLVGATGATGVAVVSGVLVAGVAAAATLTVVFSPAQVAPLPVTGKDLQSLTSVLGLSGSGLWGSKSVSVSQADGSTPPPTTGTAVSPTGPTGPVGTRTWAYGTILWSTRPRPTKTTSLRAAESAAGMTVALPTTLPAGVQGPPTYLALQRTTATVAFDAAAGPTLDGSTLTLDVGPGILAEYGGALGDTGGSGQTAGFSGIPTLAVATMPRPTATSTGATMTQLESFILGRPGFPQALAQEIRLLGNLQAILPVPVPSGVSETSTTVAGSTAVVLSVAGGTASGVVWEDHDGAVHTVGGVLDQQDVLGVARQLG
ncbi:MAG: hypothetical protein ACRDYZ_00030 [Acidimicrobiales bacterium]